MSRRELREQLFKLLFRIEFNAEEEMPQQEEFFLEEEELCGRATESSWMRSFTIF